MYELYTILTYNHNTTRFAPSLMVHSVCVRVLVHTYRVCICVCVCVCKSINFRGSQSLQNYVYSHFPNVYFNIKSQMCWKERQILCMATLKDTTADGYCLVSPSLIMIEVQTPQGTFSLSVLLCTCRVCTSG